jgi:thymidylate synthase (FAD)
MTIEQLRWKKYPVLNDGFICLVDAMGDDYAIVQAARKSYDKDLQSGPISLGIKNDWENTCLSCNKATSWTQETYPGPENICECRHVTKESQELDRKTLRHMMREGHTSPFEMVELKFLVRVPMDCWRQWIRHRTANVNEYSTRYTEAIDSQQTTSPQEWRLQATDNKQGSSGYADSDETGPTLSARERDFHDSAKQLYQFRLKKGIAKEQARKDLPLSTYTEAYWKCDLHNIFNFLRLRMDSHAQYEIRMYANAMYEIVKQVCPVACEAFEDYVLHAKKFSRMEMMCIRGLVNNNQEANEGTQQDLFNWPRPSSMTDREWKEFLGKLS